MTPKHMRVRLAFAHGLREKDLDALAVGTLPTAVDRDGQVARRNLEFQRYRLPVRNG